MKHSIFTAITAFLTLGMSVSLQAQCPQQYQGTARMYPFEEIVETPAPKGYKPYYISHYGRHGARYNTDHLVYDTMMQALKAGHDASALTAYGEEVYQRYQKMYPELQNHHGDLCRTGELQQRQLADRLVKTYPEVLKGKVKVDAASSIVPRAIVSMAAFCTELQKLCPKADISERCYTSEMLIINGVSKENPLIKTPAIMKVMMQIYGPKKEEADTTNLAFYKSVMAPIFSDLTILDTFGGVEKVASDMYNAVIHMPESEDKMDDIFSEDAHKTKWMMSNKFLDSMYTSKLDGDLSMFGILTANLMEDFMNMKDKDIEEGISVRLRFGHDMVLFGLLALMQMDDWAEGIDASRMPMASNLRMVVYKKKGAEDLVRFVFNDKECRLPIESDIAPYYKWSDVENYCSKISSRVNSLLEK